MEPYQLPYFVIRAELCYSKEREKLDKTRYFQPRTVSNDSFPGMSLEDQPSLLLDYKFLHTYKLIKTFYKHGFITLFTNQ